MAGRLTADPEISKTTAGVKCVRFTIANDSFGKQGKYVGYYKVIGYSAVADICEKYVKKGMLVTVTGQLFYSVFEKKDGTRGEKTGIRCAEIDILSKFGKSAESEPKKEEEAPKKEEAPKDIVPEELPF